MATETKTKIEAETEIEAETKTETKTKTKTKTEYVDLYVEKGFANDDPNEFISINGKNYVLPKGKTSKVPPCVKAEYERARRAREKQDENIDKLREKAKQPIEL